MGMVKIPQGRMAKILQECTNHLLLHDCVGHLPCFDRCETLNLWIKLVGYTHGQLNNSQLALFSVLLHQHLPNTMAHGMVIRMRKHCGK